jgi:HAD superfamily hydrolase (TIGR01490 family)
MTHIAFFDLDNTILSTSSGRIIVRSLYKHGLISKKRIRRAMLMSKIYRFGLLGAQTAVARWTRWFRGISADMIDALSSEWTDELKHYIRDEARNEIQVHRNNGGRTVMLSASPGFICSRMKDLLIMDDLICTELEVENGVLSGKLKGRYCYGKEKLVQARQYCSQRGQDIKNAYYYADSYSDLPVLESVGNPVCVSPDARLEKEARLRGWRVETWS